MLKEQFFDEPFFDRLFRSMGGDRFECLYEVNDHDGESAADYIYLDLIFELKFIEEEFLTKPTRVEKLTRSAQEIAEAAGSQTVLLGSNEVPEQLIQKQNDQYFESLKSHIRKARKQISSSRKIANSDFPSVLFLVNKGCYTTSHGELFEYVEGYLKRKAPEIDYIYLFSATPHCRDEKEGIMLLTRSSKGPSDIEDAFSSIDIGLKNEMERSMNTEIKTVSGPFGAARTVTSDLTFPSTTGSLTIKTGPINPDSQPVDSGNG